MISEAPRGVNGHSALSDGALRSLSQTASSHAKPALCRPTLPASAERSFELAVGLQEARSGRVTKSHQSLFFDLADPLSSDA
jgi:hypothetical protein